MNRIAAFITRPDAVLTLSAILVASLLINGYQAWRLHWMDKALVLHYGVEQSLTEQVKSFSSELTASIEEIESLQAQLSSANTLLHEQQVEFMKEHTKLEM